MATEVKADDRRISTPDKNFDTNIDDLKIATISAKMSNFSYPSCWEDNERMTALFSPFRDRRVNELHYDMKMKFWEELIVRYCEHKNEPTFTQHELELAFKRGINIPHCLHTVLATMMRTKQISPGHSNAFKSWSEWILHSFVKKPLTWGFDQIMRTIGMQGETVQNHIQFVHLSTMKNLCNKLYQELRQQQGKLMELEAVKTLVHINNFEISDEALAMCLIELHIQRKIGLQFKLIEEKQVISLIKIPNEISPKIEISEADQAVHHLQKVQTNLTNQLSALELEIPELDKKIRQLMKENKRNLAKHYLRKKHLIEKKLEKRSAALHNIDTILDSVEEALSNGKILDAYQIGSRALDKALNEVGLKESHINQVISDVQDTLETQQELSDSMANITFSDNIVDITDEALEAELLALQSETPTSPAKISNDTSPQVAEHVPAQIAETEMTALFEKLEFNNASSSKKLEPAC